MKFKYFMLLCVTCFMVSCDKDLEGTIGAPDFQVTTDKKIYKVNEPVTFNLEGNPGLISFYSGEFGKDYGFIGGRTLPAGDINMTFTNSLTATGQENQCSIWASSNFNGKYDIENIKAAKWTDITAKFNIAKNVTYVTAGQANLTDLRVEGKPLFILFKYVYNPALPGDARTWGIRAFSLTSTTPERVANLADIISAGFGLYYFGPKETTGRSNIAPTTITLVGNLTNKTVYTEDWCVSQPIQVGALNLGPDRPIAIKGNTQERLKTYQYVYSTPGVYKIAFEALDANISGSKGVIRELEITVEN